MQETNLGYINSLVPLRAKVLCSELAPRIDETISGVELLHVFKVSKNCFNFYCINHNSLRLFGRFLVHKVVVLFKPLQPPDIIYLNYEYSKGVFIKEKNRDEERERENNRGYEILRVHQGCISLLKRNRCRVDNGYSIMDIGQCMIICEFKFSNMPFMKLEAMIKRYS